MKTNFLMLILLAFSFVACNTSSQDASISPSMPDTSGKAGSMARFAISGNRLYIVDKNSMRLFNISDEKNPTFENKITLREGVETIFPYGNMLFLGTTSGMDIYDLNNPSSPLFVSTYSHVTGCDPVVVQNNYAYVTLRSGRSCGSAPNTLDVVDFKNLANPILVSNTPMTNPYGLGVEKELLFVCEGASGFKTFNLSNPAKPILVQNISTHDSFDLITNNGLLMVVGTNGLYQYSYSPVATNPDVKLVSKILVGS